MKTFFKALLLCMLAVLTSFALCACDNNKVGEWHSGKGEPEGELGAVGDFYFDKQTNSVYLKDDEGWSFLKELEIETDGGVDDPDSSDDPETDKPDESDKTDTTPDTSDKEDTKAPEIFIGYDGYIFEGAKPTGISIDKKQSTGVIEDTTAITGKLSDYYKTEFVDISSSYVALMPYYNAELKETFYSASVITEITLYAQASGSIKIGTAKVSDIVANQKTPTALTVKGTKSFSVTRGLNKIKLPQAYEVGLGSTVVIGGGGSVGIAYCGGIAIDDEQGVFTRIAQNAGSSLISSGDGKNADKLCVKVVYDENSLFESEAIVDGASCYDVSTLSNVAVHQTPFMYKNIHREFSTRTLTKIGIPVRSVAAIDNNQTFTLSVIKLKNADMTVETSSTYTLKLPKSELGTNKDAVNKYIYVDVSDLKIHVAYDQTLAFGKSTDTVTWGWLSGGKSNTAKFAFFSGTSLSFNDTWKEGTPSSGIVFDVHAKVGVSSAERLSRLENGAEISIDEKANAVRAAMKSKGKVDISFFGDSITTFEGYSRGTAADTTNSTIRDNGLWYGSGRYDPLSVYDTYWHQAASKTGLNILVNNSWSGDRLSGTGLGLTRCVQLHDDTGSNAGTNPDIISIFFGTNDENKVTAAEFKSLYTQMIDKVKAKYSDADIFVFTLLQRSVDGASQTVVNDFNTVIREVAASKGVSVVDIAKDSGINEYNFNKYYIDNTHPNKLGMDLITDCLIDALYDKYVK
ncbi:MAG: SGNH/GDSL hydrolase family protein [Clostridia bacterium]|nr:SGNH/GDSL hydrolase family protein [Clostridia bacterium]